MMKDKILRLIIGSVGTVLALWAVVLLITTNYTFGILAMFIIGALFLIYSVFYYKINELTRHGLLRAVKYIIVLGLCAVLVFSVFLYVYGNNDNTSYDEQAVIVLGCAVIGDQPSLSLMNRLDAAFNYAENNEEAIIIVSGGQGFQENVTEAEAMEKYLINKGVDPSRIIKEDKSSSTSENMEFSKAILDNVLGTENYKVAVITNDYHIFRAVHTAREAGLAAAHKHGPTEWYNIIPSYLREAAAVLKMLVSIG